MKSCNIQIEIVGPLTITANFVDFSSLSFLKKREITGITRIKIILM